MLLPQRDGDQHGDGPVQAVAIAITRPNSRGDQTGCWRRSEIWLAKKIGGMIQATFAGLVVIPAFLMGSGVKRISGGRWNFYWLALLVAGFSATGGLALGCSVGERRSA